MLNGGSGGGGGEGLVYEVEVEVEVEWMDEISSEYPKLLTEWHFAV